ncbi:MAG: hypothetical protein WBP83_04390 [Nitrososphaeraceae archaeon]
MIRDIEIRLSSMGGCPTEVESEEFAMDLKRERDLSSEIAQRIIDVTFLRKGA